MAYLLRGALIEYGTDLLGPIPNVVIFQFNPESLARNIQIPARPTKGQAKEASQAGEEPVEKIDLKIQFSAADKLCEDDTLAREFGVGPQLAALEKMACPTGTLSGEIVGSGSGGLLIPRQKYPRILFIWGHSRVLPVIIESMSITEEQFDHNLNPIQAEVSLGLSVMTMSSVLDDETACGALAYTNLKKDAQAAVNLARSAEQVIDLISF